MNTLQDPNTDLDPVDATSELEPVRTIDKAELELACIDLICNLEASVATARSLGREEHMKEGASTAKKILASLLEFSEQYFSGAEAEQTRAEILSTLEESAAYTAVQKTRTWGSAIKRSLGGAEDNEEIKRAYEGLGMALIRACATVLYHAIVVVGFDSPLGKQIDQSTVVFVKELKESW